MRRTFSSFEHRCVTGPKWLEAEGLASTNLTVPFGLQFDKLLAEFKHSIELKPVQTESYFELGDIALKQGEFDEAIQQFSRTLERDPKHGGALEGVGEAYVKKKDYARAKESLNRAVTAAPNYAVPLLPWSHACAAGPKGRLRV